MTASHEPLPPTSAIEIVRCIYDALEDGDNRTPRNHFSKDVEAYVPEFLPWGGTMKGLAAFYDGFNTMTHYVRMAFEPAELIDAGDHVIAIGRNVGIVHSTGQTFSVATVQVWHVEGDKVVKVAFYHDRKLETYITAAGA
jgi:ketosteroid isomerase-like protein